MQDIAINFTMPNFNDVLLIIILSIVVAVLIKIASREHRNEVGILCGACAMGCCAYCTKNNCSCYRFPMDDITRQMHK